MLFAPGIQLNGETPGGLVQAGFALIGSPALGLSIDVFALFIDPALQGSEFFAKLPNRRLPIRATTVEDFEERVDAGAARSRSQGGAVQLVEKNVQCVQIRAPQVHSGAFI